MLRTHRQDNSTHRRGSSAHVGDPRAVGLPLQKGRSIVAPPSCLLRMPSARLPDRSLQDQHCSGYLPLVAPASLLETRRGFSYLSHLWVTSPEHPFAQRTRVPARKVRCRPDAEETQSPSTGGMGGGWTNTNETTQTQQSWLHGGPVCFRGKSWKDRRRSMRNPGQRPGQDPRLREEGPAECTAWGAGGKVSACSSHLAGSPDPEQRSPDQGGELCWTHEPISATAGTTLHFACPVPMFVLG